MEASIRLRQLFGDLILMEIQGGLTVRTSEGLRQSFENLMQSGHRNVIVNLNETGSIDCNGLGVLVQAKEKLVQRGGTLLLVCSLSPVKKILQLTGLHKIFQIFQRTGDAVESIVRREMPRSVA